MLPIHNDDCARAQERGLRRRTTRLLRSSELDELLAVAAEDEVETASCRRCLQGDASSTQAPSLASQHVCAQCAGGVLAWGCGHFVFPTLWVFLKGSWQILAFEMRSGSGLTFNGMDPHCTGRLCCQAQEGRFEKEHVLKEVAHAAIAAQAGAPPSSPSLSLSFSLSLS